MTAIRLVAVVAAAVCLPIQPCRPQQPPATPNVRTPADMAAPATGAEVVEPALVTAPEGPAQDPSKDEVPLPALSGWRASLVLDQGPVGIWALASLKAFPAYACPEIAALDDKGRLHLLWSYSGKWTPVSTVHDGSWLGGFVHDDLDPRRDGPEIYTGSQTGHLWQVTTHVPVHCSQRLIGSIPGHEIHTLIGGDLDPQTPGAELLAFTNPGGMFLFRPEANGEGWTMNALGDMPGRIRDAALLPAEPGKPREIATVGRHGKFEVLTLDGGVPTWRTVHEAQMGMGRLSLRPDATPDSVIAYSTTDDGRVFRHHRDAQRRWSTELIYIGSQGMRGCAAGRFDADPSVETVAVHGYCKRVELLSKRDGEWQVETLFVDRDKGHWIMRGEYDGRNGTDELVATGYSGRIVLLTRPPGYGLPGVLVSPDEK
ncbi:MAG: hypothetical protein H6835_06700 [Planctomycetes bacterium]|nr:hypothetical protein [Planctomycetota bacterium]